MDNKPVLYITSPMPPSVNHYWAVRVQKVRGIMMPSVYLTKEAKEYKKAFKEIIRAEVARQGWNLKVNSTQHFYIDAVFYFDRTDKDAANYEKCLDDAITDTQLIWKDDNVALFRPMRVYYDKDNPRIELKIYPVDYIGIFDNKECLEHFKDRCSSCKRYKRNCSILKKAIEGRVQLEIESCDGCLECSNYSPIKDKKE